MLSVLEQLEKIESRRNFVGWPVRDAPKQKSCEYHQVVERALQLLDLEMDVKDWTLVYVDSDPDDAVSAILCNHAIDEDKHSLQLKILQKYWGCSKSSEQSQQIVDMWNEDQSNPMARKLALEAGVFFCLLPMLTEYSDGELFTDAVRSWILSDEQVHVASARVLVKEHNLKLTKNLRDCIFDTLNFVLESESEATKEKWKNRAIKILTKGEDATLEDVSIDLVPEFLTQNSKDKLNSLYY